MQLSGAKILVDVLKAEGVSHIFGVSSSDVLPVLDVVFQEPHIRYLQAQHEQGAMYMANGYARATRSPGICLVGPGPGITNCISGVGQAFYTSTPSLLIGIEESAQFLGLGSAIHHDLEAVAILKPVTKLSFRVDRADRLLEGLQRAFRVCLSGRKGPVYLGIDLAILNHAIEVSVPIVSGSGEDFAHPADPCAVSRAVDLLAAAERPVALAGGGAAWAQAQDALLEAAERLAMPVATTGHNKGLVPDDHPLALGIVSQHGTPPAMKTMAEADVLLAVGCTFNNFLARSFGNRVMHNEKRIIQVDIDPTEIGKIYRVEVGLLGDARQVMLDILRELGARRIDRRPYRHVPRIAELTQMKSQWQESLLQQKKSDKVPIQRFRLLHDLRRALPRDAIVAGASGGTNGWYEYAFEALAHNYAVGGWHPLGAEYPETLGIKVALPERTVVCLTGDGSLMMTLSEMATAAAHNIRVLCVVCRNGMYGNMHHTQLKRFGGRFIGTDLPIPNLANVAQEFGAYGERVEKPEEIIPAIGRGLASGKPALLEVMMDTTPENLVPPSLL